VPREVIAQLRRALIPENHSRGLALNLLLVAATPAVCEEALFRGVVLRGLATRLAPSAAIVLTGVLFGLFHLDIWRLLPSTVLGILLSWVALETRSLVPSMIIHFLNNAILVTLASLGFERRLGALGRARGRRYSPGAWRWSPWGLSWCGAKSGSGGPEGKCSIYDTSVLSPRASLW